jgi:hypothetical protein
MVVEFQWANHRSTSKIRRDTTRCCKRRELLSRNVESEPVPYVQEERDRERPRPNRKHSSPFPACACTRGQLPSGPSRSFESSAIRLMAQREQAVGGVDCESTKGGGRRRAAFPPSESSAQRSWFKGKCFIVVRAVVNVEKSSGEEICDRSIPDSGRSAAGNAGLGHARLGRPGLRRRFRLLCGGPPRLL